MPVELRVSISGQLNSSSHCPHRVKQSDGQVATVSSCDDDSPDIQSLLDAEPVDALPTNFADEQCQDPDLLKIMNFIQKEELPL